MEIRASMCVDDDAFVALNLEDDDALTSIAGSTTRMRCEPLIHVPLSGTHFFIARFRESALELDEARCLDGTER